MKKGKIAIAVFAVIMATVSVAKAERLNVDFDGAGNGEVSLPGTINNRVEGPEIITPGVPAKSWSGGVNSQFQPLRVFSSEADTINESLGITIQGISKQEVLKEIVKQYLSAKSNKDSYPINLLERSDTQILFTEESVDIRIKGSNTYLYEIQDRALVYTIKTILSNGALHPKQAAGLVCEFVKELVKSILWDIILQKWTEVWVETGKLIKVCTEENPPSEPYVCPSPMYGCTMSKDCHQLCE